MADLIDDDNLGEFVLTVDGGLAMRAKRGQQLTLTGQGKGSLWERIYSRLERSYKDDVPGWSAGGKDLKEKQRWLAGAITQMLIASVDPELLTDVMTEQMSFTPFLQRINAVAKGTGENEWITAEGQIIDGVGRALTERDLAGDRPMRKRTTSWATPDSLESGIYEWAAGQGAVKMDDLVAHNVEFDRAEFIAAAGQIGIDMSPEVYADQMVGAVAAGTLLPASPASERSVQVERELREQGKAGIIPPASTSAQVEADYGGVGVTTPGTPADAYDLWFGSGQLDDQAPLKEQKWDPGLLRVLAGASTNEEDVARIQSELIERELTYGTLKDLGEERFPDKVVNGRGVPDWMKAVEVDLKGYMPAPLPTGGERPDALAPRQIDPSTKVSYLQAVTFPSTLTDPQQRRNVKRQLHDAGYLASDDWVDSGAWNVGGAEQRAWAQLLLDAFANDEEPVVRAGVAARERRLAVDSKLQPNESQFRFQADAMGESLLGRKLTNMEAMNLRHYFVDINKQSVLAGRGTLSKEENTAMLYDRLRFLAPDDTKQQEQWNLVQQMADLTGRRLRPPRMTEDEFVQFGLDYYRRSKGEFSVDGLFRELIMSQFDTADEGVG